MGLTVNNQSVEVKTITEYIITHVIIHPKDNSVVIMYNIISDGEVIGSESLHVNNNTAMYALIKEDAYSLLQSSLGVTGVVS